MEELENGAVDNAVIDFEIIKPSFTEVYDALKQKKIESKSDAIELTSGPVGGGGVWDAFRKLTCPLFFLLFT